MIMSNASTLTWMPDVHFIHKFLSPSLSPWTNKLECLFVPFKCFDKNVIFVSKEREGGTVVGSILTYKTIQKYKIRKNTLAYRGRASSTI